MKGLRSGLDSGQAVRNLSQAVRTQRQRFLDQALAVAWQARPARVRFTDPEAEVLPEPVEALLLRWQDLSGAEAGSIEDVAAFYQSQPTGRLVVLGAPGAGKTVLLSRLVLDLLDQIDALPAGELPSGVRVPVLLSLPACDLGDVQGVSSEQLAHRLWAWITARLREDYGLRAAQAAFLMRAQRILPVLDGLDEMDPLTEATGPEPMQRPRAVAVLRALNTGIRAPVVLACRHTDYRDISQAATAPAATPTILTDARHATLRPLDQQEIITYLTARFHDRDGQLRPCWQPVADALTRETPLLGVLANPWQLFLAVTTYTTETSNPAELLAKSPQQVEDHLLANLIPAVAEHNETAARRGWTGAAAVTADTPRVRADHSERFVGFRMARTRRLTDPDRPLRLHAILTEAALRLAVGDPKLRRAQLEHLVAMAELPTVTIQVVRPEDGPHTALTGQFVVLGFENVRSIGYVELHDGAVYLQDPDQIRSYTMVAENLQRVALGPEQSVALIQSMITS